MSDYQMCRQCKEWGWTNSHRCPPAWEARLVGDGDDEWRDVHAYDAEAAAAKFCDLYDSDFEYSIVQSGEAEVEVRRLGEEEITLWDITAETVPQYNAYARS